MFQGAGIRTTKSIITIIPMPIRMCFTAMPENGDESLSWSLAKSISMRFLATMRIMYIRAYKMNGRTIIASIRREVLPENPSFRTLCAYVGASSKR